jgi:hypothetical protein
VRIQSVSRRLGISHASWPIKQTSRDCSRVEFHDVLNSMLGNIDWMWIHAPVAVHELQLHACYNFLFVTLPAALKILVRESQGV